MRPGEAGPGRKYFALTPHGHTELQRLRADWARFTGISNNYLGARRGTMNHIPEPGTVTRSKVARGIAVFRMITHWLFPIFATLMLCFFLLIDSLTA